MPRRRARAAPRLAMTVVLLASLVAPAGALARSADDRLVKPDSPAMRSVRLQPLASDVYPLLVALEKLRYAGDAVNAAALERHLARRALAALGARPVETGGTVGELAARPPEDDAQAASQVLRTALAGRLVRTEGHDVVATIENRSGRALEGYDAIAFVDRPNRDPILLRCNPEPPARHAFAPGEARTHRCEVHGNRFGVDEHFRAIAARWPAGSPLRVQATSLRFADPPVAVFGASAAWHGGMEGARSQAVRELRALDCKQRGACLEELAGKYLSPPVVLFLLAAGAGLVAALLARRGRRRTRNGVLVSLAAVVVGVGTALLGPGALGVGGYAALGLFVIAMGMLAAFLATFWFTAMMAALFRSRD